jgi:hypothetical protein
MSATVEGTSLFCHSEVITPDVIVMACHLRRRIDTKPIIRAGRNAYFPAPMVGGNLARVQTRTLASSDLYDFSYHRAFGQAACPDFGLPQE